MLLIRSTLFFIWFLLVSVIVHVIALPALILPRACTMYLSKSWSVAVLWGLKVFAGLGYEVRGPIPKGGVLVASKHMSMWDTLILYLLLDDAAVVLKRELFNIPFYGWYIRKVGSIGIDRKGAASSLRKMAAEAKGAIAAGRPVLIFPEGTRKKPGAAPDYKPGVAGLYSMLGVACIPAALNSSVYWQGFIKRPGIIVLEFLPAISPGLKRAEFMRELQSRIETATDRLLPEA
jgi:1-acyl-sn-glycerol-3-phosphate acyltransferase